MTRGLVAAVLLLGWGSAVPLLAQGGYWEMEKAYRPGVYVPYDGMSWSMRQNYYPAMIETGFGYGRTFRHYEVMEQIDRQERAVRFSNTNLLPFERMGPIFGRGDSPVLFPRWRGW